ncbi:MFS transporter [Pseudoduganella violacea]|uniref:EmrB/QacA subfamily drug resistance transporter n=1 Tax=Pseudoduganella violacea TaxID=1715466 RepID=A0A7W5FSG5_9BURK|nr:MFS transporter [Pseudoduganella violacea]MBB3117516.1 EmrB/QacA subfamily drug resistance transporter [Pseudoduganella violacea]
MSSPIVLPPALLRPHLPPWVAVAIACLSSFMVVMDGAIVNVALPSMQAELGLSASQLPWVVDAYLLVLGGCMLLAARAGDLFGRRRVLQAGLAVFTLASLAGGLAASPTLLLGARAVQGLGAAALATSTLAVIVAVYPHGAARGRAISCWAASSAIASACGVLIGAVLTAQAGWRWVMFVNVPPGLLLMAAVSLSLQGGGAAAARDRPPLDLAGAASVTLGMGALIYGLSQGAVLGWSSAPVRLALAAAALLLAAFLQCERRVAQPLLPLAIFRLHNVRMGNIVVLGLGASLTAASYLSSLVLQQVAGYGVLDTGLALLPMSLALAVAAIVSRPLLDGGLRRLPFYGGLCSAAGLQWLSHLPAQPVFANDVLGPTVLTGLGLGLMLMTATHTALAGVPGREAGLASGLFNTARQLGAALGIALLSTLAHAIAAQQSPLAGYQAAFSATAVLSLAAALASLALRPSAPA